MRDIKEATVREFKRSAVAQHWHSQDALVVILVMVLVARQFDMVHPDSTRALDTNCITYIRKDLLNPDVSDNDIRSAEETQPDAREY